LASGPENRRRHGEVLAERRTDVLHLHVGSRNDGLGIARSRIGRRDADADDGVGRRNPATEKVGDKIGPVAARRRI